MNICQTVISTELGRMTHRTALERAHDMGRVSRLLGGKEYKTRLLEQKSGLKKDKSGRVGGKREHESVIG